MESWICDKNEYDGKHVVLKEGKTVDGKEIPGMMFRTASVNDDACPYGVEHMIGDLYEENGE